MEKYTSSNASTFEEITYKISSTVKVNGVGTVFEQKKMPWELWADTNQDKGIRSIYYITITNLYFSDDCLLLQIIPCLQKLGAAST
jgi:hypothetical protein